METEDEAAVDAPDDSSRDDVSVGESNEQTRHATRNFRHRHKSDVFIAEGFYTDCENLLKQFLAKQTSTFEDFVAIWQEKKFPLIFNGRDSYSELLEFSDEALIIAKSFILPPHSQIKRIGALYLMYGLFTQQPYRDTAKFRVTPQEWSVILKFVENLKAHGFIDANYIFHKMCLDGAFLTVSHSREYGLERNFRKYFMNWQAREKELEPGVNFSLETLMSRVCRGSLKSAADKLLTKYNNIKKVLAEKKDANFQSLKGTEKGIEQVMLHNMISTLDGTNNLDNANKISNLGVGRRSIIQKAFAQESRQKGSQCALLFDTPEASAASTSQTKDKTVNSNDDSLEMESQSDSEDSDLERLVNPIIMRPTGKQRTRRARRGKSQRGPSLGKTKSGPTGLDSCFEELTGLKNRRSHKASPAKQKKTGSSLKVVEENDFGPGAPSCPTEDFDEDGPSQALSKGFEGSKLKSPASGKARRKGKQSDLLSAPLLQNDAEPSTTVTEPASSAETATKMQAKNRGRRKAGDKSEAAATKSPEEKVKKSSKRSRKSNPLNSNDSGASLESPEGKSRKTTKRSRKSIPAIISDPSPSLGEPEISSKKSTQETGKASLPNTSLESPTEKPVQSRRSRKSDPPNTNNASPSLQTPEKRPRTSTRLLRKSNPPNATDLSPGLKCPKKETDDPEPT